MCVHVCVCACGCGQVPASGGEVHLVSLRAIRAGEEVTVSYRAYMGVDSYRASGAAFLADEFSTVPDTSASAVAVAATCAEEMKRVGVPRCRCGAGRCVHGGLSDAAVVALAGAEGTASVQRWTTALEEASPRDLLSAVAVQLSHARSPDSEEGKTESGESRLTQVLLLLGRAVPKGPAGFGLFAVTAGERAETAARVVLEALATAKEVDDGETRLHLALLEVRVRGKHTLVNPLKPGGGGAVAVHGVPARVLQFLLALE